MRRLIKTLQAQIEPHFLYNTLANVHSLIETDPNTASAMLENFIKYLRSSLARSRDTEVSLKQEVELLRAYLDIQKVRLSGRLEYSIHVDDGLMTFPLPPMLLQPLVENAVKHGVEPKIRGGKIEVTAREENGHVRLTVADNGIGFTSGVADGFGLVNVRSRVNSLYAERGRFSLCGGPDGGVTAEIIVPREK
ncbi:MAG: histidine kinase [Nitrospinae bacterium]|nr:histidine kinase [Nitrospinota bacterium]